MQKKCDYCGNYFDDTLEVCPICGAPNDNIARSSDEQPKTIEELKKWYTDHKLPPENVTRFFIGKNVKEPKAFGIYKDENTGNYVVYKNKADGTRAVRYDGKDQKYAVNELYQRLRAEISDQNSRVKQRKSTYTTPSRPVKKGNFFTRLLKRLLIFFGIFVGLIVLAAIVSVFDHDGYYTYNDTQYYYYNDTWYYYDDVLDDWMYAYDLDSEFLDNYSDYYESYSYDSGYGGYSFNDSDYYSSGSSSSSSDDNDWGSDWDNDSSWDWGSSDWDSGSSDWDSDW